MPTYDYICENCGHQFELFQSITARPLRQCPKCSKRQLKRLIGIGSGVIFKGSGFYQTDYRSESYKKAEKSEKPPADKDTAKKGTSEKKTETKEKKQTEKQKSDKKDKKKTA
jgi:putative FmdB family regulatory protein